MRIPSEELQKRIVDTIRYRFYDRLNLYDVYRWLDNFQDDEQELAVSVFEKLEYYREEDLLGILSNGLDRIICDCWKENKKTVNLIFMPLGRPGKSGHVIQYLVKNLLKSEKPKHTKTLSFYNHPKELNAQTLTNEDVVVFLDDIIGSGETFISDVSPVIVKTNKVGEEMELQNEWTIGGIVKADMPYKVALLSCILMDKGKIRLEATFPFVKLYGEERIHAFSKNKSPFGGYLKMK